MGVYDNENSTGIGCKRMVGGIGAALIYAVYWYLV
jgi:hypothetical protein